MKVADVWQLRRRQSVFAHCRSPATAKRSAAPPNFGEKLMRPGFGPEA
jgi:hypothetical protein